MLETLVHDLRYGLRMLAKSPGFTAVAVLSLALGIGANTAIFTLINAVMLKTLPVKDPKGLVLLDFVARDWPKPFISSQSGSSRFENGRYTGTSFSYRTLQEIHDRNQSFSTVFGFANLWQGVSVVANGQAGKAAGQVVSGEYFSGLGVQPIIGRTFTPEDDRPGAAPAAVISYGYWQRRFGTDRSAVGKAITVNGVPFTIVGVTQPEFFGVTPGSSIDISLPLHWRPQLTPTATGPDDSYLADPQYWWVLIMGRLKPGITAEQATAGLDSIFKQSITEGLASAPGKDAIWPSVELGSGSQGLDFLRRQFSKPLWVLMTVVGLVLLIACTNVANLLLSRAAARQKEIAIRLSIGASRVRLIRQLLTESVLLATLGGLLGLLFAYWGCNLLVSFLSSTDRALLLDLRPDLRVLGFTAAVCLFTGLLFGLAPALRATRLELTPALKQSPATLTIGRLRMGLPKVLVIAQVAMSLVLLFGAVLFVRTLVNLKKVDVGFQRENLLVFSIDAFQAGYKDSAAADVYDNVQERLRAVPGVKAVTMSSVLLMANSTSSRGVSVPGYVAKPGERTSVRVLDVGHRFFETMGIPLLLGRTMSASDKESGRSVAVINKRMADQYFNSGNPVGRTFSFGNKDTAAIEIAGVVANAKYERVRGEDPPIIYLPYRQNLKRLRNMTFEVRTSGDPNAAVAAVRKTVQSVDPNLPLFNVKTMDVQIAELLNQESLFANLSSFFGFLALLLACVGLYGTMSYAVERRIAEIGLRMALGAGRGNIFGMVLREILLLVAAGTAIGIAGTVAGARYAASVISSMLFGLEAGDRVTLAFVAAAMIVIAAAAGLVPARRASQVAPIVALRSE